VVNEPERHQTPQECANQEALLKAQAEASQAKARLAMIAHLHHRLEQQVTGYPEYPLNEAVDHFNTRTMAFQEMVRWAHVWRSMCPQERFPVLLAFVFEKNEGPSTLWQFLGEEDVAAVQAVMRTQEVKNADGYVGKNHHQRRGEANG